MDGEGRGEGEAVLLYPDFSTVLVGRYQQGRLQEGRQGWLGGLARHMGVPWPEVVQVEGSCVICR